MKTKEILQKYTADITVDWQNEFRKEISNYSWSYYSASIALKTIEAMERQHMTQTQLADRLGCSQQYVSKILKGQENLTLETIARLESALNLDIIHSSFCGNVAGYRTVNKDHQHCLSDVNPLDEGLKPRDLQQ